LKTDKNPWFIKSVVKKKFNHGFNKQRIKTIRKTNVKLLNISFLADYLNYSDKFIVFYLNI